MKSKIKQLDFTGETIFTALDVHKKNWRVTTGSKEFELEHYTQNPKPKDLARHLKKRYPGAKYIVAYEAGFCGFGIQRSLKEEGIDCIIVNAADIPTSNKEKRRKQDKIDSRKIYKRLAAGDLEGIYVPQTEMEHARSLVRERSRIVDDQTRCKNRIWSLLMFSGLSVDADKPKQYWSRKFIESLKQLDCGSKPLREALDLAIEEYILVRQLLTKATKKVRELSSDKLFAEIQQFLRSIPGVGLINAMVIHTELQFICRFKTLDHLCSYTGIVPDSDSSGDKEKITGITHRSNNYLREAIIESSWVIVRKDPAMLMLYKRYCARMDENKAIIKIARHLLNRIRYVWMNQTTYEIGIAA
ncbi:MAG: IS110 family transposase [Flavisolibacter sp.]|jgi:transposase